MSSLNSFHILKLTVVSVAETHMAIGVYSALESKTCFVNLCENLLSL
jgi:hypothetical protein